MSGDFRFDQAVATHLVEQHFELRRLLRQGCALRDHVFAARE